MPKYEFQCKECSEIFEDMVNIGQKTRKCPYCGGRGKKIISAVGVIFKGSGWYCTDSRSGSTLNGNGSKRKLEKTEEKVESSETPVKSESTKSESTKPDSPKNKKSEPSSDD